MLHILLEGFDIDAPWLYPELQKHIRPWHTVAVVALSYRDSRVTTPAEWQALYGRENGRFYGGIVGGFAAYGIPQENISFLSDFTDTKRSAAQKVAAADIVYFLGGLPDRMMERIHLLELEGPLLRHTGLVMGYSAGAVIQLAEYHLSPDEDYPHFRYEQGLGYLDGFYLQVHYQGTETQKAAIRRVLSERGKTVYATAFQKGALLTDGQTIQLLGDVKVFRNEEVFR